MAPADAAAHLGMGRGGETRLGGHPEHPSRRLGAVEKKESLCNTKSARASPQNHTLTHDYKSRRSPPRRHTQTSDSEVVTTQDVQAYGEIIATYKQ